jgi:hypothetical protein
MQRLTGLNLVPRRGAMEEDVNPCTRNSIKLYKETLSLGDPLSSDELEIFKAQFATLLAGPGSEERKVQLDRIAAYVIGLRAIKHELGDIAFTGLNPEDTELGFGHIRPVFLKANAPAAPGTSRTTWSQAYLGTGYIDWIFDGAATAMTEGDSVGLIITHVMSLVTPTPFTAEIRFTAGRTGVMIPVDVRALRVADNINGVAIVPVPTIVSKPKATLYAESRPDLAGTDELAVRGLVVGLGRALRAESPAYPQV